MSRLNVNAMIEALGGVERWAKQCHAASLCLVRSGVLGPEARVARGWCRGVTSQHSWVVLGDPYDPAVTVVDPTLWSYVPELPVGIWIGDPGVREHRPHGWGSIWRAGRPVNTTETLRLRLTPPNRGWSMDAQHFLSILGPLDSGGWMRLANCPVGGWPAKEILGQYAASGLEALIPIDVRAMLLEGGWK